MVVVGVGNGARDGAGIVEQWYRDVGTYVNNACEVGRFRVTSTLSKGKEGKRIESVLDGA